MRTLPELKPCPSCGLGLQRGRGPHGLVHHECRARSEQPAEQQLLELLLERARMSSSVRDLAAAYEAVAGTKRGRSGGSPDAANNADQMLRWLNRKRVVEE